MSRIPVPARGSATGATAEVHLQIKKTMGNVPNTFAVIGAHGPAALKAMLLAGAVLAIGSLSKQDQETICPLHTWATCSTALELNEHIIELMCHSKPRVAFVN